MTRAGESTTMQEFPAHMGSQMAAWGGIRRPLPGGGLCEAAECVRNGLTAALAGLDCVNRNVQTDPPQAVPLSNPRRVQWKK